MKSNNFGDFAPADSESDEDIESESGDQDLEDPGSGDDDLEEDLEDLGEEDLDEDPDNSDEAGEDDLESEGDEMVGDLGDVLYSDSDDPESSGETGKAAAQSANDSDVEVGKAVRNQLRIWDGLLCLRIRLQKILIEVNKLPNPELFARLKNFSQAKEGSSNLELTVEKSFNSFSVLTSNLLSMQELMLLNNSETKEILTKSKKAKNSTGNKDAEEISSEDEDLKRIENEDSDKDSDEDDDEAENKEGKDQLKNRKRKVQHVNYAEDIHELFQSLIPFRNETIEKWNTKTEVATGKFKGKVNYASFNISALKQINQILSDKERLIKRTQLKRSQYSIIGEDDEKNKAKKLKTGEINGAAITTGAAATKTDDYNEEIFDDDDFYHQLLREVIESKTSNVLDPTELSTRWLELQKIRGKTKRKVDTKSSKGRKIRYAVLPKLVNFMAPHDECPMTENAYKELLNSLFANASI